MSNLTINYYFLYNKRSNVSKNRKVMYDWIHISSNYKEQGLSLNQVLDKTFVETETENFNTKTVWRNAKVVNETNNKALHISANDKGYLNIKVCPPKFIHGNNVQEATIVETLNLFAVLSNMVGYDLGGTSQVRMIDITHTATTDFHPKAYYPYLCNQVGEQRWLLDSTLYYGAKKSKQKKFYDKVRDTKKTGGRQEIPVEYRGMNMTRFEVGLGTNNQIGKIIGDGGIPMLGHLFTVECVEKLHNYWQKEYNVIPKLTELDTNFMEGMGLKGVKEEITKAALSQYGRLNIEEEIERAAKMGALSYSQKSKARKQFLKPFEEGATKNDLIKELDGKILGFEPKWE
tara:strand:+ start:493 stop:1527 length:1035 start_codon:yes stop_codon:yes gene_type:complete